jgi:hypothetical protein
VCSTELPWRALLLHTSLRSHSWALLEGALLTA